MANLALYREWRPQTFDEVVSQEQVVYPLKQAVISRDIGHAYLFSGTRGTGKTSLAKIFAKAVNCLEPENGNPCNRCRICEGVNKGNLLDVMEIDAASNNSVDNIRRITDEIIFTPSEARYKVYIIDEVHMLSQGAFNALLKTLEEPPAHAIFILATTEPHRIPATILSRCQRYEFRRIPAENIVARLREIAKDGGISITEDALLTIARLGDGALRDSISLLDQCRSGIPGEVGRDDVLRLVGIVQDDFLAGFSSALFRADLPEVLSAVDRLQMSGRNVQRFLQDFCRYLRDILLCRVTRDANVLLNVSENEYQVLRELAEMIEPQSLINLITRLSKLDGELRWSGDPRTALELELIAIMTADGSEIALVPESEARPIRLGQAAQKLPHSGTVAPEPAPVAEKPVEEPVSVSEPTPVMDVADQAWAEPIQDEPEPEPAPEALQEPEPDVEETIPEIPQEAEPVQTLEYEAPEQVGFHFPAPETVPPAETNAVAVEAPAHDIDSEPNDPINESLWEKVLEGLRKRFRIDLVMLLRPARIFDNGRFVRIVYDETLTAHCQTMRLADNRDLLREMLDLAGHPTAEVQIELQGEAPGTPDGVEIHNGNEAEPEWFRKLREDAAESGLEVVLQKEEEEAPPEPFPPFALPEDTDEIPF